MKIGLVGLGRMGYALAQNMHDRGLMDSMTQL